MDEKTLLDKWLRRALDTTRDTAGALWTGASAGWRGLRRGVGDALGRLAETVHGGASDVDVADLGRGTSPNSDPSSELTTTLDEGLEGLQQTMDEPLDSLDPERDAARPAPPPAPARTVAGVLPLLTRVRWVTATWLGQLSERILGKTEVDGDGTKDKALPPASEKEPEMLASGDVEVEIDVAGPNQHREHGQAELGQAGPGRAGPNRVGSPPTATVAPLTGPTVSSPSGGQAMTLTQALLTPDPEEADQLTPLPRVAPGTYTAILVVGLPQANVARAIGSGTEKGIQPDLDRRATSVDSKRISLGSGDNPLSVISTELALGKTNLVIDSTALSTGAVSDLAKGLEEAGFAVELAAVIHPIGEGNLRYMRSLLAEAAKGKIVSECRLPEEAGRRKLLDVLQGTQPHVGAVRIVDDAGIELGAISSLTESAWVGNPHPGRVLKDLMDQAPPKAVAGVCLQWWQMGEELKSNPVGRPLPQGVTTAIDTGKALVLDATLGSKEALAALAADKKTLAQTAARRLVEDNPERVLELHAVPLIEQQALKLGKGITEKVIDGRVLAMAAGPAELAKYAKGFYDMSNQLEKQRAVGVAVQVFNDRTVQIFGAIGALSKEAREPVQQALESAFGGEDNVRSASIRMLASFAGHHHLPLLSGGERNETQTKLTSGELELTTGQGGNVVAATMYHALVREERQWNRPGQEPRVAILEQNEPEREKQIGTQRGPATTLLPRPDPMRAPMEALAESQRPSVPGGGGRGEGREAEHLAPAAQGSVNRPSSGQRPSLPPAPGKRAVSGPDR